MPNLSKQNLEIDRVNFIEDVASLLMPWGVPQTAARLYGYLLLCDDPVSLDRITADLEVSKSSASVAARLLERYALARRFGERGSKRVLYGATDNYAGLLSEQSALLGSLGRLLQSRVPQVASGLSEKRLTDLSKFYLSMHEAMEASIDELTGAREFTPGRMRGGSSTQRLKSLVKE